MAKAVLVAHVHPTGPEHEAEFNRWYDEVHIPQVIERIPGIVGGSRYKYAEAQLTPQEVAPPHRYLALYEVDTDDLEATVGLLGAGLTDGTLDLTEALNVAEAPPVLHFYNPVA